MHPLLIAFVVGAFLMSASVHMVEEGGFLSFSFCSFRFWRQRWNIASVADAKLLPFLRILTMIIYFSPILTYSLCHVGLYWRGGALLDVYSEPGFHFKLPYITRVDQVQVTVQTDKVTNIPVSINICCRTCTASHTFIISSTGSTSDRIMLFWSSND